MPHDGAEAASSVPSIHHVCSTSPWAHREVDKVTMWLTCDMHALPNYNLTCMMYCQSIGQPIYQHFSNHQLQWLSTSVALFWERTIWYSDCWQKHDALFGVPTNRVLCEGMRIAHGIARNHPMYARCQITATRLHYFNWVRQSY
jgi:hypothetical protein